MTDLNLLKEKERTHPTRHWTLRSRHLPSPALLFIWRKCSLKHKHIFGSADGIFSSEKYSTALPPPFLFDIFALCILQEDAGIISSDLNNIQIVHVSDGSSMLIFAFSPFCVFFFARVDAFLLLFFIIFLLRWKLSCSCSLQLGWLFVAPLSQSSLLLLPAKNNSKNSKCPNVLALLLVVERKLFFQWDPPWRNTSNWRLKVLLLWHNWRFTLFIVVFYLAFTFGDNLKHCAHLFVCHIFFLTLKLKVVQLS